ncbi:hypothetical protein [Nocardia salmonicida]|uniref:hypothetical protein n=1 Tax=Nocardia salmonicida TaxID=53431 RepID=UPI003CE9CB9C
MRLTGEAAYTKYSAAERDWQLGFIEPLHRGPAGIGDLRLPAVAYRPTQTGRRLDE